MFRTPTTLVAAALVAILPTLTVADGTAVALSASLDDGSVSSVAVAAAFGDFAVASSVANANSTGAASGASDDALITPSTSVTYNSDANAYETSVTFAAVGGAVAEPVAVITCDDVFAAAAAFEFDGDTSVAEALVDEFGLGEVVSAAQGCGVDLSTLETL